jgi:ABC-type cobalamin/Fe3+-siderophores transport system ATPase subunit
MIIGIFLRHYKIYKGANYIPFGINQIENLNLFIGQNGAGKSSILEALDTYFNQREFIFHTSEKKTEAFVAPLFYIPKEDLQKKFSKNSQKAIPIISEFLFGINFNPSSNYKPYESFFEQQKNLTQFKDDNYMFLLANWGQSERNDEVFITFNGAIKKKLQELEDFDDDKKYSKLINSLKADISKYFAYQYIPVETSIQDFLRLESKGMQDLLSEDVKKRIEKTLNEKLPIKAGRVRSQSILDIVNTDLENFVAEVENTIQEIDNEYDFQKKFKEKTKITANHLTDVMIETFFSKRKLKKGEKPIKYLSAGERKKALIDIAYAFLTQNAERDRKFILAIDEPESSLHISMCYEQFDRLERLANDFNTQLLVTSHWYGALPIIDKGNLYHISPSDSTTSPSISEFSFRNYFEENGSHPNDVQFKSFFDLASAIISSLRNKENNWMIVESEEDKNYINKHIDSSISIKYLPVGGCGIVKLLYNYLHTPISHKSEKKELLGRVFCLIDTDIQGVGTQDIPAEIKGNLLKLRRLQIEESQEIKLHKLETDIKYPTEIEESMNPKAFYLALKETIESSNNEEIKTTFASFGFDEDAKNSYIKGDNSIIFPIKIEEGKNPNRLKDKIVEFIDDNKKLICDNYCKQNINGKPEWISKIEKFYTEK